MQQSIFTFSDTLRKAFMSVKLHISIRMQCALSNLLSLGIFCNCLTTSRQVTLSSYNANFGHSAMALSWSFAYSMTSRMTSTNFTLCPLRFLFDPLEPILQLLPQLGHGARMSSGDMLNSWLYIVGMSILIPSLGGNLLYPLASFDPTSTNVSIRPPIARSFPNKYESLS